MQAIGRQKEDSGGKHAAGRPLAATKISRKVPRLHVTAVIVQKRVSFSEAKIGLENRAGSHRIWHSLGVCVVREAQKEHSLLSIVCEEFAVVVSMCCDSLGS